MDKVNKMILMFIVIIIIVSIILNLTTNNTTYSIDEVVTIKEEINSNKLNDILIYIDNIIRKISDIIKN